MLQKSGFIRYHINFHIKFKFTLALFLTEIMILYGVNKMKTVYDLMTKDVITITKDTNLNEIIKIMKEKSIGKLPVIDDAKVVGVVTRDDLLIKNEKAPMPPVIALNDLFLAFTNNKIFREKYEKFIAFEASGFMRKDFLKVNKETSIEEVITDILEKNYEFALVFEGEKLVGILTKSDLINSL